MKRVVIAFLLLSSLAPAWGWNRAGHMLVARIAWDRLPSPTRQALLALLHHHPAWSSWSCDGVEAFERAATWPDDIKKSGTVPPEEIHAHWHYVDIPVTFDGTATRPAPTPNVETALAENLRILKDRHEDPARRAVALSWVLHLVGDIHQPLHCAEWYSAALPHGDQGGNRWAVRLADGTEENLHALWDDLVVSDEAAVAALASQLPLEFPTLDERTPEGRWARESHDLAVDVAYLRGKVPGAVMVDRDRPPPVDRPLTTAYLQAAKVVARRQVARAGTRLGHLLGELSTTLSTLSTSSGKSGSGPKI
jgi:hypothetical protein